MAGTTSVATLPASYFYESGQPLTTGATGRLVMTPVTTAPTQVKLQTALSSFEEKPKYVDYLISLFFLISIDFQSICSHHHANYFI